MQNNIFQKHPEDAKPSATQKQPTSVDWDTRDFVAFIRRSDTQGILSMNVPPKSITFSETLTRILDSMVLDTSKDGMERERLGFVAAGHPITFNRSTQGWKSHGKYQVLPSLVPPQGFPSSAQPCIDVHTHPVSQAGSAYSAFFDKADLAALIGTKSLLVSIVCAGDRKLLVMKTKRTPEVSAQEVAEYWDHMEAKLPLFKNLITGKKILMFLTCRHFGLALYTSSIHNPQKFTPFRMGLPFGLDIFSKS